ncbi:MAG TPA: MBL fold metallo-hydrolase [Acidobacteriaceae bacterium]|nr:MBL fold metallo-hydrolase [Acidobacteriaceae bacterium]
MPRKRSRPRISYALKLVAKSAFRPAVGPQLRPVIATQDQLGITFIGHASFLLQLGGRNILIDPNFAYWLVLIHRFRRPGVRVRHLPPIHAVLLTHAHMDHLNLPSLRRILRHNLRLKAAPPLVIVPPNVEDIVSRLGFSEVRSLAWWQSTQIDRVEVTATPAQHWGARVFSDTHRGYGGYVLRYGPYSVYHVGDTGYFPGFAEIRDRLAPKIALVPIGAYKPEGFLRVHMSPEDAVRAFLDLNAQRLIPMHYGTFSLSEEPMDEPLPRLLQAAETAGISSAVDPLREGETRTLP